MKKPRCFRTKNIFLRDGPFFSAISILLMAKAGGHNARGLIMREEMVEEVLPCNHAHGEQRSTSAKLSAIFLVVGGVRNIKMDSMECRSSTLWNNFQHNGSSN